MKISYKIPGSSLRTSYADVFRRCCNAMPGVCAYVVPSLVCSLSQYSCPPLPCAMPAKYRYDLALSREHKNAAGGKMYVQDKVEEYADEIFERLDDGAHIYFCGLKVRRYY